MFAAMLIGAGGQTPPRIDMDIHGSILGEASQVRLPISQTSPVSSREMLKREKMGAVIMSGLCLKFMIGVNCVRTLVGNL